MLSGNKGPNKVGTKVGIGTRNVSILGLISGERLIVYTIYIYIYICGAQTCTPRPKKLSEGLMVFTYGQVAIFSMRPRGLFNKRGNTSSFSFLE
jgi:hypothetical protein